MGAVSSICCEEDKKKGSRVNKESNTPLAPNSSSLIPTTAPPKKSKDKQQLPSTALKQPKGTPTSHDAPTANKSTSNPPPLKPQQVSAANPVLNKEPVKPSKEVEDITQVIEKMYPPPKAIKWQSFQILGKIGSGGFGEVFLAELKENKVKGINEKYAIKRVIKNEIFKKKLTTNLTLEKKILQESRSKFITALHYAFRDQYYLYFVMQWAPGGDTYTLINQASPRLNDFKKAGEDAVRFILGCLILGMEYLHSKNIMYRDLKPENVLIFQNGYAKLTDFGLAKEIREDQLSKTEAGTTIYYAPQMVLKEGYQKEIDIWAIGVYAYQMSNYYPPFASAEIKDKLKVKRVVKMAEQTRIWKNKKISQDLKDFINSILKFDPKERLGYKGVEEMKSHPFFTNANFNWSELEAMKMKSPLKPIIEAHKIRCKPYNPNEVNKKLQMLANIGKSQEPECWTYARDKND